MDENKINVKRKKNRHILRQKVKKFLQVAGKMRGINDEKEFFPAKHFGFAKIIMELCHFV